MEFTAFSSVPTIFYVVVVVVFFLMLFLAEFAAFTPEFYIHALWQEKRLKFVFCVYLLDGFSEFGIFRFYSEPLFYNYYIFPHKRPV